MGRQKGVQCDRFILVLLFDFFFPFLPLLFILDSFAPISSLPYFPNLCCYYRGSDECELCSPPLDGILLLF